jgi:type II secretory pathway component PulM
MKLQDREKKLLIGWAVVMTLGLGYWATSKDEGPAPVVQAVDSIPSAEKRLARLRQLAASVPGQ